MLRNSGLIWTEEDLQVFLSHRQETVRIIHHLNSTIDPPLFVRGEDPRNFENQGRREFSTISRGSQTTLQGEIIEEPEPIDIRLQRIAEERPVEEVPIPVILPAKVQVKRRKYACGYCNRKYKWRSSIYRHVKADHVKGEFICVSCNVRFTQQTALFSHEHDRWRIGLCKLQTPKASKNRDIILTPLSKTALED